MNEENNTIIEYSTDNGVKIAKVVCTCLVDLAIIATAIGLSLHTGNYKWMWLCCGTLITKY